VDSLLLARILLEGRFTKIRRIEWLRKRRNLRVVNGYKELKKTGVFLVPGFAKFVVIKKPATKARKGTNPFTGEPMMFKAKPARKIVRARPVKAAKDAV
jgi:nucleoid DNA-binding protein